MVIKVAKENDEIITKFVFDDGKESAFDYIKLIDSLYNGEHSKLEIDGIETSDKNKIEHMYEEICKVALKSKGN